MEVLGIDISKSTFDVWSEEKKHHQFSNDTKGFKALLKLVKEDAHCVMEATGCYHVQLANFLFESKVKVSVVNPLVVKRFIQMKRRKTKTDKSDAQMLCRYGISEQPKFWEPEPAFIEKSKLLLTMLNLYIKQQTQLKNKLHNLTSGGISKGIMISSLKRQLKQYKKELEVLEVELESLMKEHAGQELSQLTSIPGVGKKTATLLLVTTNCFRDFTSSNQVSAYVGLAPVERSSGSSIRGRSYISKAGNPILRNHLFMCSFTASEHNPQCKALYTRITAKGKSKKLALTAVCNKLIKQAYGITKNNLMYDYKYKSVRLSN